MIEVSELTKDYGPVRALRGVSFTVPDGQVVGFLGPNGAGKTTTMKILTGYLAPTSGTATIAGFDVSVEPVECQRRTGYLPEGNPLYTELRVVEALRFAGEMHGLRGADRDRAVEEAVDAVGLGEMERRPIGELSKGYRQRVGLAQALLHKPQFLILDEPTSGLDPNQQQEMRALIRDLGRERTVILSTHILPEVEAICDRALIVHEGRLVLDERVADIRSRARGRAAVAAVVRATPTAASAAFAGLPGVATVEAADIEGEPGYARVRLEGAADRATCEAVAARAAQKGIPLASLGSESMTLERVFAELTATTASAEEVSS
jgi:ABC-2 type transport system ATP-binding protein